MSIQPEVTSSCVLHITITHLFYHVIEEVLDELFGAYGVHDLCVSHKSTHMEVFVEFQSWLEASQAKGALHGRCIYDGSCLLDIQHAPSSISVHRLPNSEPVVVDWDCVELADHVELEQVVSLPTPSDLTSAPASATITSITICEAAARDTASSTANDVGRAHGVEDVLPSSTGCISIVPASCSVLCLQNNCDKLTCTFMSRIAPSITHQVQAHGPTTWPFPSLVMCIGGSCVPRPLPCPFFMCDRGGDCRAFPWPAPQGTLMGSSTAIVVMNCFPGAGLINEAPSRKPMLTWTPSTGYATMPRKSDARSARHATNMPGICMPVLTEYSVLQMLSHGSACEEWFNSPWDPGKGTKYYVLFVLRTLVEENPIVQGTIQFLKICVLGIYFCTMKHKANDTWTLRSLQHGYRFGTISMLFSPSCSFISVEALFTQLAGSFGHLSYRDYLNLLGSCCKIASTDLLLYGNDLFMGHTFLNCWKSSGASVSGRYRLSVAYEFARAYIQFVPIDILLVVPLLPVHWYCTMVHTSRKATEVAGKCYFVQLEVLAMKNKNLVLAIDIFVQWDPGIRKIVLRTAIILGKLQSIFGPDFHDNTSTDHLLGEILHCQDFGQYGID
ncbi:hypothetical protein VPH35_006992 [Triticum aestivum]